jgi:alkylation response protein AidB-like acyl-CoA dehydrogenase
MSDAILQDLTADFATRAALHDAEASFPFENFARLHDLGLLGLTVPHSRGGRDASLAEARAVIEATARGDASTALVLVMQLLFQRMVAQDEGWPEALRDRIGREAVESGALINALSVEPELGTPQRGGLPATVGVRAGEGWRLSGRKRFSTGIPLLTWLAVVGRTDEAEPRMGLFVVRRDAPGISVVETWNHLGMRATHSHDVVFDDTPVEPGHFVPMRPFAERAAGSQAWAWVLLASLYNAVAEVARDWLVGFLKERTPTNLGAPLSTLPRMQEAVGRIEALLYANRTLLDSLTARIDADGPVGPTEGTLVKYLVTGNAVDAVTQALELTGNHGLSRNNPLERHYRDVLCSRVHTPQNDVILTGAGRAALA